MEQKKHFYSPCLRWKLGEYQAVNNLKENTASCLLPLIEVPEMGYDFEIQKQSKTIDEHIESFAKKVNKKWGKSNCMIDLRHVSSSEKLNNGQHPATHIFDELNKLIVIAVPVVTLESAFHDKYRDIVNFSQNGLCIRSSIDDIDNPDFSDKIINLANYYKISLEELDLIIDLGYPNFDPIKDFAIVVSNLIKSVQNLNSYRNFFLLGTSFPQSMAGIQRGVSIISRNEWHLYREIYKMLQHDGIRIPIYGDYAINHPKLIQLDMRLIQPSASLRYTLEESWIIVKGTSVRKDKFHQYRKMCSLITDSNNFYGRDFSEGDEYIYKCAKENVSTGNLTVWRRVGTNHHIELVSQQISKLYGQ